MSNLLELKEYIKKFYAKNEGYIVPFGKFLLALVVLLMLNMKMGYMEQLDSVVVVLVAALFCSFMPIATVAIISSLFMLLHFYALSFETAIVVFALLLVMYLLFVRLVPKESMIIVLTVLAFAFKIPYVIPIAVGLLAGPISIVSMTMGVVIAFLIQYTEMQLSATSMSSETMTGKLRFVIDGIIDNDAMFVFVFAFAFTVIIVYFLRRSSMDHAWTIAIGAGILTDIVILLIGDLILDLEYSVLGVILGSVVATVVAYVIQFFAFNMDYSRTEKVQFEDDEYYYYVKAVPKISVSESDKRVKKINTNQRKETSIGRGDVSDTYKRAVTEKRPASRTTVNRTANSRTSSSRTASSRTVKTAHGVSRTTDTRRDIKK